MKTFSTKTFAFAFASLFLFSCERNEERDIAEPMALTQNDNLIGYDPTTCNLVQSFGEGTLPRAADVIEEDGAVMIVKAQKRGHNGKYLQETQALLLDAHDPATDLVNRMDASMLAMTSLLTVGDGSGQNANRQGGRLILDFSPVNTVTMKTMVFTDIAAEDKGSKVELYSRNGQLLESKEIPTGEKNSTVIVSFNNIPAVAKAIVTFGDERSKVGSGAVARLQLCVEGPQRYDDARYQDVHTLWLEYTGQRPANVTVKSVQEKDSGNVVFEAKGMKPGTLFKIAATEANSLGESLEIKTQRGEKQLIPVKADPTASLKKEYGSFRVIEARCGSYPLKLEE
ncbi:hypothetical protein K3G39_10510 [Pontibacter sp. HSC-14F20]|uniref:hypothetical protein n=1 Tax=Pontibacter sp. HSC-14F20 TaxID=2864136 RepID=UPI001C732F7A|nr:hypothetical protein [Pontibacter sp. HSC-14F20]MBX0333669.1 hypothetical protein [Pontibacter sp. HSC-14F20]